MASLKNVSGALFILPNGTEIAPGETADVDAKTLEVPGVSQMIGAGKLNVEKGRGKSKSEPEHEPEPEPAAPAE